MRPSIEGTPHGVHPAHQRLLLAGALSLIPHLPHPGRDIDPDPRPPCRDWRVNGMTVGSALEEIENAVGNEAAAHRQDMGVAVPMLMAAVQAHRLNQMQVLPGALDAPRRRDRAKGRSATIAGSDLRATPLAGRFLDMAPEFGIGRVRTSLYGLSRSADHFTPKPHIRSFSMPHRVRHVPGFVLATLHVAQQSAGCLQGVTSPDEMRTTFKVPGR